MSYQIYYKFKVFHGNGQIYVFSLDGSNNGYMINRHSGYQMRERDWRLFYRGTRENFPKYLAKIDQYNEGFNVSANNSMPRDYLFKMINRMSIKSDHIGKWREFFYLNLTKAVYEGTETHAEIIDLEDFKEEDYFNHNSKQEHLHLADRLIEQLRAKGYG